MNTFFHQYTVRVEERDKCSAVFRRRNRQRRVLSVPLHLQPLYRFSGTQRGHFPHSEHAAQEILSLHVPGVAASSIARVAEAVTEFVRH